MRRSDTRILTTHVGSLIRPAELLERNRREGVFGVIGRLRYRGGRREGALLGLGHPGAAWLEWLAPMTARAGTMPS